MAFQPGGLYAADSTDVHPIRLSTTDYAAGGTPPAGPATSSISAQVSRSRRALGLHPRTVLLARTVGTAPNTFNKYKRLVVLTPSAFTSAAFANGATITISTVAWTVVGRDPEKQK